MKSFARRRRWNDNNIKVDHTEKDVDDLDRIELAQKRLSEGMSCVYRKGKDKGRREMELREWKQAQNKTGNVHITLRRVRATIAAVEKSISIKQNSVCVCSLRYAARNAHAPYCHLWPVRTYIIFPHYLIKGTTFEKKKRLLNTKCVF
jgi:hypothetical protein